MTREELEIFIDTFVRNSAYDSFMNLRMNTILKSLLTLSITGITDTYDTYDEFKQAIAANKVEGADRYMRALVKSSSAGQNRIFEYMPAINQIFWTASQKYEQLT